MWMIRSPRGGYVRELINKGIIGLGWGDGPRPPDDAQSPQDFYDYVKTRCPQYGHLQIASTSRQLYEFFRQMTIGDTVMTYDSLRRTYHVGVIAGPPDTEANSALGMAYRPVEWRHKVQREQLSRAAHACLRSRLPLFRPAPQAVRELQRLIGGPSIVPAAQAAPIDGAHAGDLFSAAMANARESLKQMLMKLTWEEMQALVAGILRAMGYKTEISPWGRDRGKDIIASPDGLGLEHPRIFVEVKHHKGRQVPAAEIRKFGGGRHAHNDRCLFVSTAGFSLEARYEAERAAVPLTLIDGDRLVDLLLEHYERADVETRALAPLRKIYWPMQAAADA